MKTIGLIGGMSWESSLEYYRIINEESRRRLGGLHSAKCMMYSFDFSDIEELMREERWGVIALRMIEAVQGLENEGADFVLICSNTMHKMAEEVRKNISVPLIHIADPTAEAIRARGITKVILLGTKYTMEEKFYKSRLADNFGLEVVIPREEERNSINDIIFNELCMGVVRDKSRERYVEIIRRLVEEQDAKGVIFGCTEIGLLVRQSDVSVPVFDTTHLHAEMAVSLALQ